jgi:hypothetical protein
MAEIRHLKTKKTVEGREQSEGDMRKNKIDYPAHWQYTTDEALQRLVPEGFGRTLVITRDVLDNAGDAAEKHGGIVRIDRKGNSLLVTNKGVLTKDDVETLIDFSVLRTEKYSQRAYIRGQIGHGLKLATMLAIVERKNVTITSGGYRHVISLIDRYADDPRKVVSLGQKPVADDGTTTISLPLPDDPEERGKVADYILKYISLNPHLEFVLDGHCFVPESDLKKNTKADIDSYDSEAFCRLAKGYFSRGMSVRDFLLLFNVSERNLAFILKQSGSDVQTLYLDLKALAKKVPPPVIGREGIDLRVKAALGYGMVGYKKINLEHGCVEIGVFNGEDQIIIGGVNGSCVGENEFWLTKGNVHSPLSSIIYDLKITKPVFLSYYSTCPLLKDSNKQTLVIADIRVYDSLKRLYRSCFPAASSKGWLRKKHDYVLEAEGNVQIRSNAENLKIRPVTYCFLEDCREIADEMFSQYGPITIRQLYYQLVSRGTIENSSGSYDNFVNHMKTARELGIIDYDRFEDRSRYTIFEEPASLDVSPKNFIREVLEHKLSLPSLNLWHNQPYYVELWIEKDALVTLFAPVARKWQVMLFPSRGYTSLTKIEEARVRFGEMSRKGRKVVVLYAGDLDPSGWGIYENINNKLSAGGSVVVERIALNPDQVGNLYSMPVKRSDTRYKQFLKENPDVSGAYELDAMNPAILQQVTSARISGYLDDALVPREQMRAWENEFKKLKKHIFGKIRLD